MIQPLLKPGKRKKLSRVTRSGRVILNRSGYAAMRPKVYEVQEHACFRCHAWIRIGEMDIHHHGGRGAGKHNDVPWFDNEMAVHAADYQSGDARLLEGYCYGLCRPCHDTFGSHPQWSGGPLADETRSKEEILEAGS